MSVFVAYKQLSVHINRNKKIQLYNPLTSNRMIRSGTVIEVTIYQVTGNIRDQSGKGLVSITQCVVISTLMPII